MNRHWSRATPWRDDDDDEDDDDDDDDDDGSNKGSADLLSGRVYFDLVYLGKAKLSNATKHVILKQSPERQV